MYTTTAINGTNFCTSAKDAVFILTKSSAELASISCFGGFIIFLGKVGVKKVLFCKNEVKNQGLIPFLYTEGK